MLEDVSTCEDKCTKQYDESKAKCTDYRALAEGGYGAFLERETCEYEKDIDWDKCKAACQASSKPSATTPAGPASADTKTPTDSKTAADPNNTPAETGAADTKPPVETGTADPQPAAQPTAPTDSQPAADTITTDTEHMDGSP
jgi:hypothetical protein